MRPANLVVIMSDEHHPRAMGAAGHPFAFTPNLDQLAARGTRFDTAYCNSPICVPSRASFATGRYVHELGAWDNAMAYDGRVEGWGHALQKSSIGSTRSASCTTEMPKIQRASIINTTRCTSTVAMAWCGVLCATVKPTSGSAPMR